MMRGMRGRASAIAAVLALIALQPASAAPSSARAPVPGSSCRVFPADNVWNMDISKLPVAKKNKVWKRSMHAGSTLLHPDFGPPNYGIPFDVVDGSHPTVHVDFGYADESDPGPYPFGPDIHVEGGSDRHAIMIDGDTCTLYELYAAEWNGGEPTAGSGAIFHLEGPERERPAAGDVDVGRRRGPADLPRARPVGRGRRRARSSTRSGSRWTAPVEHYVWPARHQAGSSDGRCPPMGARFRLKAGFDTSQLQRRRARSSSTR